MRDTGEVWQRAAGLHLEEKRDGADFSPAAGKAVPGVGWRQLQHSSPFPS